jgi:hypothetical protein
MSYINKRKVVAIPKFLCGLDTSAIAALHIFLYVECNNISSDDESALSNSCDVDLEC